MIAQSINTCNSIKASEAAKMNAGTLIDKTIEACVNALKIECSVQEDFKQRLQEWDKRGTRMYAAMCIEAKMFDGKFKTQMTHIQQVKKDKHNG